MANVAVNQNGVVGVMWYDRRDHRDNIGWDIRFRASVDGGQTWLPSVKVSEKPNLWTESTFVFTHGSVLGGGSGGYGRRNPPAPGPISINILMQPRQFNAGDYSSIVADAHGRFHPFWIDNRTGKSQVWTAPITVDAVATRHGGGAVGQLEDLSSQVTFNITHSAFDRATKTVSMSAQLENKSTDTLAAPIMARVVALSSELARSIRMNDVSEGDGTPGSVVAFSDILDAGLLRPGEISRPKRLTFKLSDLLPIRGESEVRFGLVSLQVTVLGKTTGRTKTEKPVE